LNKIVRRSFNELAHYGKCRSKKSRQKLQIKAKVDNASAIQTTNQFSMPALEAVPVKTGDTASWVPLGARGTCEVLLDGFEVMESVVEGLGPPVPAMPGL
jgi:hypothetical protein